MKITDNRARANSQLSASAEPIADATLLGTKSLIEDEVYDAGGKFLGEIEEIVLDVRTGCVRYAVLGLGGFLGIGRKRFAVPWSAITPDADYRRSVIDVALMHLMAVPVSANDPWLRRAERTCNRRDAGLLLQQALGGSSAKTSISTFRPGSAKKNNTALLSN